MRSDYRYVETASIYCRQSWLGDTIISCGVYEIKKRLTGSLNRHDLVDNCCNGVRKLCKCLETKNSGSCFCEYSLHSNVSIGCLGLSDLNEIWPKCSAHMGFWEIQNSFLVASSACKSFKNITLSNFIIDFLRNQCKFKKNPGTPCKPLIY